MIREDCQECGTILFQPKNMQKYCVSCSNDKHTSRIVPLKPKKAGRGRDGTKKRCYERGDEINKLVKMTVGDFAGFRGKEVEKFSWKIPWSECHSKNAIWSQGRRKGHVFIRKEIRQHRDKWIDKISEDLKKRDYKFHTGKIWMEIFACKPDNRSDAINLVDNIADMLKEAIGVDDRWFSLRRVDWQIVTEDPCVWVSVAQEHFEEHFICAFCRRIMKCSDRKGHQRICKYCQSGEEFEKEIKRLKIDKEKEYQENLGSLENFLRG